MNTMRDFSFFSEAYWQRVAGINAYYSASDQDALDHLRNVRRGFNISDSYGVVEADRQPWEWIETDNHGNTHGADIRKEAAVHEAGHCVSAFILGSYPEEARVFKSRGAKRRGVFRSLASIHGYSVEQVKDTVDRTMFDHEQAQLAASCQLIELYAGVAAAMYVGGVPNAAKLGFNDDWKAGNILAVFSDLDVPDLRSLAAWLVVYYANAIKAVAMKLYEESRLFTEELLDAAMDGFGPEFRVHPRVRWALKEDPYRTGLR